MTHDISQVIQWLRLARDYTEELPEFEDPDGTVKSIEAHLSSAIAALESEPEPLAVVEGYMNEVDVDVIHESLDPLPWVSCASLQREPDPENGFTLLVTHTITRKPDA